MDVLMLLCWFLLFFFFQAEDGIRDLYVTGVQTCALPIYRRRLDVELLEDLGVGQEADRRPGRVALGHLPDDLHVAGGVAPLELLPIDLRSEERRVGKECRSRGSALHQKNKEEGERTAESR